MKAKDLKHEADAINQPKSELIRILSRIEEKDRKMAEQLGSIIGRLESLQWKMSR